MRLCNVPPSAIGEHSSSDPDPVLMASIANDSTKEVLIFKQSAGTGFDAPRAFVLASTKPVNDSDFAAQFIGRVMRVHRAIRAKYPRPIKIDPELNTAYVYLGNAQAQTGFEQAVANTANLKTQLEGQTEKLVARKMASGAMAYTNRETDQTPMFYDTPLPEKAPGGTNSSVRAAGVLPTTNYGSTGSLLDDDDTDVIEDQKQTPTAKAKQASMARIPRTRSELQDALAQIGVRTYKLRTDLVNIPLSLMREDRPEMENMAFAATAAATKLDISPSVLKNALAIAMGKAKEKEVHTELTEKTHSDQSVFVVMDRAVLSSEAHAALANLPQVEEADTHIILNILTKRLRPSVESAFQEIDELLPPEADLKRTARDAAFAVIRKEHVSLGELLYEEIATQAVTVEAGALPSFMMFAQDIGLPASSKNIYGVFPPNSDDLSHLSQVMTIDVRDALSERIFHLDDGTVVLAPFDGSHAAGEGEVNFAKALDRADFVKWWHRNPSKKSYSVRLVRGEHQNYFYPDFVVCLEHYPGAEPLQRLIETKYDVTDAVRKSKRISPFFGRVLFLKKDQTKWKWINIDGTLGSVVDMDDLLNMQEWLRQTVPIEF